MTSGSVPAEGMTVSTGNLVLETPNPLDLSIEDLAELAAQLEALMAANEFGGVPVKVKGNEPLGVGHQLIDYLYIILPNAEFIKETVFTTTIAAVTVFMRKRFKRKHEAGRPRQINVYDSDGELLRILRLKSENADPEWVEPSNEDAEPE